MQTLQTKCKDRILVTGWIMILVSAFLYVLPLLFSINLDEDYSFRIFAGNFLLSVSYWIYLKWHRKNMEDELRIHYRFSLLVLFLISAFSLNRMMTIFESSPVWLSVLIVLVAFNYLVSVFFKELPVVCKYICLFISGSGFVLFIYYSFFLLPIYLLSVAGLLVLGVSIHTFIPLMISIQTIRLVRDLAAGKTRYYAGFGAGILCSLLFVCLFAVQWSREVEQINKSYRTSAQNFNQLPAWVEVASKTSTGAFTEKVLKSDVVYKEGGLSWSLFGNAVDFDEPGEQKVHDPLVITAALFAPTLEPSREERLRILESKYKARHQAQERLWSGHSLITQHVKTHVRVWPEMHLTYTEKTITVYNEDPGQFIKRPQEGIYTFHMPEGAVVTALSLWIEGVEEKGVLTTKEKAAEAYRTVVGVEKRDPSVIHWQEGNTVSVRVFPVLPGSARTFKVGITAPLLKEGDQLIYDNIWFFGPDAKEAKEKVSVEMVGSANSFTQKEGFRFNTEKGFEREGRYKPRWMLQFHDAGLRPHIFGFEGREYYLQPYNRVAEKANFGAIYLDINEAWSAEEFRDVWSATKDKKVFVYDEGLVAVTEDNKQELFQKLSGRNFTLFPFHKIEQPETALVVSKSNAYSPNLKELEGTSFCQALKEFAREGKKIRFFNIGRELSCYLRSVKEFRLLQYDSGSTGLLTELIRTDYFPKDVEDDNTVVIHSAGISIVRKEGEQTSSGPDHLMRLFAYNHIMHQLGVSGMDSSATENSALVQEAQKAFVVSPVSSLVVLETQRDYDRFDIKNANVTLQNASMNSSGAVPEPHEWALILLALSVMVFLFIRSRA
jgi:XrtN system VIT domain protein